jgi:hypothetical protein
MKTFKTITWMLLTGVVALSSCKKDDPEPDDENELITTVQLVFKKDGSPDKVFTWRDISGSTSVDTIQLEDGTVYELEARFLDESKTPVEEITEEIAEEDEDHQVFYISNPGSLFTLTYQDEDANGLPIGLNMRAISGDSGSGTLRVVLKHAPGEKDGNLSTGSTDVDITFPVKL